MLKKWKTISSEVAFDNKWMRVRQETVELPNGKVLDDYFIWEEGQIVMIVPVTAKRELVMVRQYKQAYGEIVTEFPAGWVDENEDPLTAAYRELQEETGHSASKLGLLKTVISHPTKVRGKLHIYLAENVIADLQTAFDENEDIEILIKPYEEVMEMVKNDEIVATPTIAALFLTAKKLGWKI